MYNSSKDNKRVSDRGQCKNAKRPTTATIKILFLYPNMNTVCSHKQTSVTLWLNEHLSSVTSHSEAFGGPLVLIKTRTSFSTQLWHNLKAPQLAAKQLVFLLVSEVTQFQRNKVTQETYGPPKELLQCQNALIVCLSRKAACFFTPLSLLLLPLLISASSVIMLYQLFLILV